MDNSTDYVHEYAKVVYARNLKIGDLNARYKERVQAHGLGGYRADLERAGPAYCKEQLEIDTHQHRPSTSTLLADMERLADAGNAPILQRTRLTEREQDIHKELRKANRLIDGYRAAVTRLELELKDAHAELERWRKSRQEEATIRD